MRGEVVSLTRNLKIQGNSAEKEKSWGCQILSADILKSNGEMAEGQTLIDSIEMENCSQIDTERATIRFENNVKKTHSITNSAFHSGLGMGFRAKSSKNISLINNVWFNFKQVGVAVDSV